MKTNSSNYVYLVEVRWHQNQLLWMVKYHVSNENTGKIANTFITKFFAVWWARRYCRRLAKEQGTNLRLELQVYNKDGQLGKGRNAKESYGRDPRTERG